MALYELGWANIEINPYNRWYFFARSQGVNVTVFSGGNWRPWWCLWLCTGKATLKVDQIDLHANMVGALTGNKIYKNIGRNVDGLDAGETFWGVNPPSAYTSVRASGVVRLGTHSFEINENFVF